jgi:hypothetical protein
MDAPRTMEEHIAYSKKNRFPWCDVCKLPAVFREGQGYLHSTPESPFGVYTHNDPSDHKVTCKEWWNES